MTVRNGWRISPGKPICGMEVKNKECGNYATYAVGNKPLCGTHKRKGERVYGGPARVVLNVRDLEASKS